jgi:hypothetical protein
MAPLGVDATTLGVDATLGIDATEFTSDHGIRPFMSQSRDMGTLIAGNVCTQTYVAGSDAVAKHLLRV